MRAVLSLILLAASGCVHRYVEPAPTEPHALVHIRMQHHTAPGPRLDLALRLDGYALDVTPMAYSVPSTRTIRVRPVPAVLRFRSHFFHSETRLQHTTRTESYACGSYTSGYGRYSSTQTRYCTRQVPEQRWVTVTVTDGLCDAQGGIEPRVGASYLLHYDFYGHGNCNVRCFRQLYEPSGSFRLVPCGSPEDSETAGGEAPALPLPASYAPGGEPSPQVSTPGSTLGAP
ncbi:MAG: hypothetical protein IT378_15385 [Sandaracinaceae bacterium]|nr:hypothetical protein [Sandaracinaceae bacterium]